MFLGDVAMAMYIAEELNIILASFQCKCQGDPAYQKEKLQSSQPTLSDLRHTEDVPIYGPDKISVRDCIDFVNNTVALAQVLIDIVPSAPVRGSLTLMIRSLSNQAISCCRKGGIWKSCVQPLMNKYHLWNQKWKVFGIPPDPSW